MPTKFDEFERALQSRGMLLRAEAQEAMHGETDKKNVDFVKGQRSEHKWVVDTIKQIKRG